MNRYLKKGSKIFITGAELLLEKWTDKKTGDPRQAHKLSIFKFEFGEKKSGSGPLEANLGGTTKDEDEVPF